jgi:hypothetical protein
MATPLEVSWVAGWTAPRDFALSIDGAAPDLTGWTVTLILRDPAGSLVASPGSVTLLTQSGATLGHVRWTPASASILANATAATLEYRAHFELTSGSTKRYFPNVRKGEPMLWHVTRAGG